MNPQFPASFAGFHTHLGFVIDGLNSLPYETTWEGRAQLFRENIQLLIDTLHQMLVDVNYVFVPNERYPDILGMFASQLAHYTPRTDNPLRHNGDHRSYAIRMLHSQLTHLLGLERTWTLRQDYVQAMITDLAQKTGQHKGILVMVQRAIYRLT